MASYFERLGNAFAWFIGKSENPQPIHEKDILPYIPTLQNQTANLQIVTLHSDLENYNAEVLPSTNSSKRAKQFYQALKKLNLREYKQRCDEFVESQMEAEGWTVVYQKITEFQVSSFLTEELLWAQLGLQLGGLFNKDMHTNFCKWIHDVFEQKKEHSSLMYVCEDLKQLNNLILFFFFFVEIKNVDEKVKSVTLKKNWL